MMAETWKPIPDFPGYEVSDHGRVRSYKKPSGKGAWTIANTPQRILKPSKSTRYLAVLLSHNGIVHRAKISNLVLLAFIGPCPDGMEVCHNNDNPTDDRLENLRYDTHKGNMLDRRVLSDDEIVQLRKERADGKTAIALAKRYGLSKSYVIHICSKYVYQDVGGPITKHNFGKSEVVEIRKRRANGTTLMQLADEHGITESAMSLICTGKRYHHYGEPFTYMEPNIFSEPEIVEIRTKRANGATLRKLAAEYDVSSTTISKIATGKSYTDHGGPLTFGRPRPPLPADRVPAGT